MSMVIHTADANRLQANGIEPDRPITAGAEGYSTGQQPGHTAKPKLPNMTPEYFATQCKMRGGGASMNPDGTFKCSKPDGSQGMVPYPIPID